MGRLINSNFEYDPYASEHCRLPSWLRHLVEACCVLCTIVSQLWEAYILVDCTVPSSSSMDKTIQTDRACLIVQYTPQSLATNHE